MVLISEKIDVLTRINTQYIYLCVYIWAHVHVKLAQK